MARSLRRRDLSLFKPALVPGLCAGQQTGRTICPGHGQDCLSPAGPRRSGAALLPSRRTTGAGAASAKMKRIIVIGAGMGGLSAAIRLAQMGYSVTTLEARATPGGLASGFDH